MSHSTAEDRASDSKGHITDSRPFRFYDNRQKYLGFVNTCNEKWKVAERTAQELSYIQPTPPAFRLFDAGMGDGTLLAHLMRAMHRRFPTIPFYVVGKEISLEDVRLTLEKMPDRFVEHPAWLYAALRARTAGRSIDRNNSRISSSVRESGGGTEMYDIKLRNTHSIRESRSRFS